MYRSQNKYYYNDYISSSSKDEMEYLVSGIHCLHVSNTPPNRGIYATRSNEQNQSSSPVQDRTKIKVDPTIFNIHIYKVPRFVLTCVNRVLSYEDLEKDSDEYNDISNSFGKYKLIVTSIKQVHNVYLQKAFELTRQLKYQVQPRRLFHGTKQNHVDSICTYNFDWRLSGNETGHKFGKGVNFAKTPYFAAFFCDRGPKKVIIIADVLMENITGGKEAMILPPMGYDTTRGKGSNVLVKFYDNEFCPRYVVNVKRLNKKKKHW